MTSNSQPARLITSAQIVREDAPTITMNILNHSSRDLQGYALPPRFDGGKYVIDVFVSDMKPGPVVES
jgi:glycosyltransferase A (GT-A) superfamily protein (DUF2064 family)